jgi:predicted nucleic acid-binding protein
MPNACFVDTNLLLYVQDPNAPQKARRVAEWLGALADEDSIIISPQVLNEYAHNVLKKFKHVSHDRLFVELAIMQPWCRAALDSGTAVQALKIHLRFTFSFYDSCLIASALEFGCRLFLSEDLSHGQRIAGMQFINPFQTDFRSVVA